MNKIACLVCVFLFISRVGFAQNNDANQTNAVEANVAIVAVGETYPDLDVEQFYAIPHSVTQFAGYQLWRVSHTGILPEPSWVVAVKSDTAMVLGPLNAAPWNRIIEGSSLNLDSRQKLARFPVTYLRITSTSDRPKWKFSKTEIQNLSQEGKNLVQKGWVSQRSSQGYILNFFSVGNNKALSAWRVVTTAQGIVRSVKRFDVK